MSGIHPVASGGFSTAAGHYARARPAYARAAVGLLAGELPDGVVLDLAAGTGILSGQLLRAGRSVMAAEPLPDMLDQLRRALPAVPAVSCTAESLPFAPATFGAVTVAQAFHWFDAPRALAEVRRVLGTGGVLAMVFNIRDESVGWVRELTDLVELRSGGRPYGDHREESWDDVVGRAGGFGPGSADRFVNHVASSPAALVERVRSTSFVAVMPDDERERLIEEVRAFVDTTPDLAGRTTFDYPHVTEVRRWRVTP